MRKTTVVYGPPGSGKTRNAERLARHFGCRKIIDGWEDGDPIVRDALHLTGPCPHHVPLWCWVIPIHQALREIGVPAVEGKA